MNFLARPFRISGLLAWLLTLPLSAAPAASPRFEQLDYSGLFFDQPDSAWGQVTIDYLGSAEPLYFNLNVGGAWRIENMPLEDYFGQGEEHQLATFFDLGVAHGTPVSTLDYIFSIDTAPRDTIPTGSVATAVVEDGTYFIGGVAEQAGGLDAAIVGDQLGKPQKIQCNSPVVRSDQVLQHCSQIDTGTTRRRNGTVP